MQYEDNKLFSKDNFRVVSKKKPNKSQLNNNSVSENNPVLESNDDLLGATVVYRTTLLSHVKKASDSDFDEYKAGSTGPTDPVEFPSQTFIIERVSSEDSLLVEFELASVLDLVAITCPKRQCTRAEFPSIGTFVG